MTTKVQIGLLVVTMVVAGPVRAQTAEKKEAKAQAATPKAVTVSGEKPTETPLSAPMPAAQSAKPFKMDFAEAVYLLYPDFSKLAEPDRIVIPVKQWEQFLRRELENLRKPKAEPVLTSLDIQGKLFTEHAELTATVAIRVDSAEGGTLDLQLGEAQCTAASLADGSLPFLAKQSAGPFSIAFDGPGLYVAKLNLVVRFDGSTAERKLQLSLPEAPVKNVVLTAADRLSAAQDFRTNRRFALRDDGKTFSAPLEKQESLHVAWRVEVAPVAGVANLLLASGPITYRINAGSIETDARLRLETSLEIRQVRVQLPPEERVVSLVTERAGKALPSQFQVTPGMTQTLVTVNFGESVSGIFQLRLVSERSSLTSVELGRVQVERADSQFGQFLIYSDADVRVRAEPVRNAQRQAISQLDVETQRTQPLAAFRYFAQPSAVRVTVEKAEPIVSATTTTDVTLQADRAEITTKFLVNVLGAPIEQIRLRVPSAMTDLQISPLERFTSVSEPANPTAEGAEIVLTLAEPTLNEVEVQLRGVAPIGAVRPVVLLLPQPASKTESSGTVKVRWASNVWPALDSEQTKQLFRRPTPTDDREPAWYFRHRRGPLALAFTMRRLPQVIDAETLSELRWLGADCLVHATIRYRAQHEPMEHAAFHVPPGVTGLTVRGDKITADQPTGAGVLVYPLANASDQCEIQLDYRIPNVGLGAGETSIPLVTPREASTTRSRAALRVDPALRVALGADWEIDTASPSAPGRIDLVFSGPKAPDTLPLRFSRSQALAALILPKVAIEEMVTPDGRRRGVKRCLVTKRRVGNITVVAPEGCLLREVLVDGQAVGVLPSEDRQYRVPLPATERTFVLEMVYDAIESPSVGLPWSRNYQTPGFVEPVAIQETRWWIETARDAWLVAMRNSAPTDLFWRNRGILTPTPMVRVAPADWFREGAPELTWTAVFKTDRPVASHQTWTFASGPNADTIDICRIRAPVWGITLSALVIAIAFGVRLLAPRVRVRLAVAALALFLAGWLLWSDGLVWIWVGSQWGFLAVLIGFAAELIWRPRKPIAAPVSRAKWMDSLLSLGRSILSHAEPAPTTTQPRVDAPKSSRVVLDKVR